MNETLRQQLLDKNQRLIDMVIERVKRDFSQDIVLIGLTGSINTEDFHEHSDLDLILVNDTPQGWGISRCFLLGEVGYDIYCTPWEPRLRDASTLASPHVSNLLDMRILYSAGPEHLAKYQALCQNARDLLALPIGKECLERAQKHIDSAKQSFADALLARETGPVRYAAGMVLYHALNAIVSMNNRYITRGIKRYREQLLALPHLPEDCGALYDAVIGAKDVGALREAAENLLRATVALHGRLTEAHAAKTAPSAENLRGTYEELWCNCRNKVKTSAEAGDASYAFFAALGAQNYLDEMIEVCGAPKFDVMTAFDPEKLGAFGQAFERMVEEYRALYDAAGLAVDRFDTLEELYADFMK